MRLNEVYWYKNLGNLNFSDRKTITTQAQNPIFIDVADINNDGFNDVLITNENAQSGGTDLPNIDLFINNTNQSWTKTVIDADVVGKNHRNYFTDIDNDNDLDILNCNERDISLYTNDGSGNFGTKTILVDGSEFYNMIIGDFNNDTKVDFIANTAGGTKTYLQNTPTDFTESTISTQIASTLLTADIDNDNDLDLLLPLSGIANIDFQTMLNNGNGSFTQEQTFRFFITSGQASNLLTFKDLDNDDFVDLLYVPIDTNEIATQRNNQSGTFETKTTINSDFNFTDLASDDLDNDGDNDIVWFSYEASPQVDNLGIIENIVATALVEESTKDVITIYPNPTTDKVFIKNTSNKEFQKGAIYTVLGKQIVTFTALPKEIDFSKFANGIYILKINDTPFKIVKK